MPDFWLALVLIYIFYTQLGWIAAPLGRIDMAVVPPKTVTGSLVIDSLLTGNFEALSSSFGHLVLPVLTLGIINAGPILKMTQTMVSRALTSEFVHYAEMCGLPRHVVLRQAVRAALPAIVTIVSVLYGFLIGGAVLVEIVFSSGVVPASMPCRAYSTPTLIRVGLRGLFRGAVVDHLSGRRSDLLRARPANSKLIGNA